MDWINSGINKIYVLTQFNSQSLNRHLARTYDLGNGINFGDGFVEVLAATQTSGESGKKWFQGTADAVMQFVWLFEDAKLRHIENMLILSGDHLYRMDYVDFLQKHIDSGADISVSCLPVDGSRASEFGLMKIDETGRINQFLEKPKGELLKTMQVDTTILGLHSQDAKKLPYIASTAVYLFKSTDVLLKLLKFHYMAITDNRQRIMPMPDDRLPGRCRQLAYPEVVILTDPINPDLKGEVDDKYQYSCDDKDNKVHGWISFDPPIGFWQITPSDEFRTGGPLKQNLTSHVGPTTLAMFMSAHYAGDDLVPKF